MYVLKNKQRSFLTANGVTLKLVSIINFILKEYSSVEARILGHY